MDPKKEYISINKSLWNKRTEIHLKSDFYKLDDFLQGKTSLNQIELDLLGNIQNKRILHLKRKYLWFTLFYGQL